MNFTPNHRKTFSAINFLAVFVPCMELAVEAQKLFADILQQSIM
jgi:hypothetical protein